MSAGIARAETRRNEDGDDKRSGCSEAKRVPSAVEVSAQRSCAQGHRPVQRPSALRGCVELLARPIGAASDRRRLTDRLAGHQEYLRPVRFSGNRGCCGDHRPRISLAEREVRPGELKESELPLRRQDKLNYLERNAPCQKTDWTCSGWSWVK